jgi:ATP-dependent DNA ligase
MDLATMQPTKLDLDRLVPALVGSELVAERKWDGHRLTTIVHGGDLDPRNRHGARYAARPVPVAVRRALAKLDSLAVLDGELLEDRYVVFDLRCERGEDLEGLAFAQRRARLERFAADAGWGREGEGPVSIVDSVTGDTDSLELAHRLLLAGAEGLVLKDPGSRYRPGRTTAWRKAKFTRVMAAVAGETTARGTVALYLADDEGQLAWSGSAVCFSRPPRPGTVVEVRYRLSASGALREAVVIDRASPRGREECVAAQLDAWPHLLPGAA